MESPAHSDESAQPDSHTEADSGSNHHAHRNRRQHESRISDHQRPEHKPRVVIWHCDENRIHRRDDDRAGGRYYHGLLRRRDQNVRLVSLVAQGLDRVHHVVRLVVIRIAELRRPTGVLREIGEHIGERRQRLHRGVPRHRVHRAHALRHGNRGVLHRPALRGGNLVGISGCGQNLRHQRVRIKSDGRYKLIQLRGVQRNIHAAWRLSVHALLHRRDQQNRKRHGQCPPERTVENKEVLHFHHIEPALENLFILPLQNLFPERRHTASDISAGDSRGSRIYYDETVPGWRNRQTQGT